MCPPQEGPNTDMEPPVKWRWGDPRIPSWEILGAGILGTGLPPSVPKWPGDRATEPQELGLLPARVSPELIFQAKL